VVAKQVSFSDWAWLGLGRVISYVDDGNGNRLSKTVTGVTTL
jgi:hypothetical protein